MLTAEFSRAYFVLSDNRKLVIRRFEKLTSFNIEAATQFIKKCETRPKSAPKPQAQTNTSAYERMADVANQFGIFSSSITAADLLAFRNHALTNPLLTDNIARAAFFLSLLSRHHLLPHNWQEQTSAHEQLASLHTGKVPSAHYLATAASRKDVAVLADVSSPNSKFIHLTIEQEIALCVKNELTDLKC